MISNSEYQSCSLDHETHGNIVKNTQVYPLNNVLEIICIKSGERFVVVYLGNLGGK